MLQLRAVDPEFLSTFGLKDRHWVQFAVKWLLVSLFLHLIAGVMSVGFYDMDEHFQVMEFLGYRLGRTPLSHLTGEFTERDRSWMQPTLYEGIVRFWMWLGVVAPSVWACSIRLFSSFIGWLSLVGITLCSYRWFPERKYRELSVLVTAFLYCIPYLHARTASENLSGSFFFIAVSAFILLALRESRWKQVSYQAVTGIGFLLGLAFACRFQMGFMIVGFGLWCLMIPRVHISKVLAMAMGFFLALVCEVVMDWRGYGEWTFAPWNYLNIAVLQGKAAGTGIYPWWYYFEYLKGDVPLLGNLLAALVIFGWLANPSHPLTFSTLPFFIAHTLLAHKEPRYLFPLISGVPVLVILGYRSIQEKLGSGVLQRLPELLKNRLLKWIPWRWIGRILVLLNMGGLVLATLKPAAVQPLLHTYLFNHPEIQKLYYLGRDPFELIGHQVDFYRPMDLEVIPGESFASVSEKWRQSQDGLWLFYTHFDLPPEAGELQQQCKLQYSVFPNWQKAFLFLPGLRLYSNKNSVFWCAKAKTGK